MKYSVLHMAIVLLLFTSCSNIGPNTVQRDRFDYNTSIADSWKEQALLNIVRLRYADMPLFVDVASVVSGYTLTGSVNLNGTVSSKDAIQGDFLALGTTGQYTDRPTITYSPISGEKFTKNFMTPIPPKLLMFLIESGWQTEMIFPIVVSAVNGLRGSINNIRHFRTGDSGYYRVISLLQELQTSGHTGMSVVKGKKEEETINFFVYRDILPPENMASVKELEKLLGLRPGGNEFKVTYGILPETDQELALQTRSLLQMMIVLAAQVDVPPEHITGGLTPSPSIPSDGQREAMINLIKIHSAVNEPEGAFVSVRYKDYWFWIEDSDFSSKRIFTFMIIISSLLESGGEVGLPLVTIPAG